MYKEFELPNDHALVIALNKLLAWARTSDVPDKVVGDPNHRDLSEERLQKRIANEITNSCRMARFDRHEEYDFTDVQVLSEKVYKEYTGHEGRTQIIVAKTWYPPVEGYLGWHIDEPGGRIYSTYAEGKSFFRYQDPNTKEIVTSWDKPEQWSFRVFTFDEGNPMWHCVKADDLRVSIGYKFIKT